MLKLHPTVQHINLANDSSKSQTCAFHAAPSKYWSCNMSQNVVRDRDTRSFKSSQFEKMIFHCYCSHHAPVYNKSSRLPDENLLQGSFLNIKLEWLVYHTPSSLWARWAAEVGDMVHYFNKRFSLFLCKKAHARCHSQFAGLLLDTCVNSCNRMS